VLSFNPYNDISNKLVYVKAYKCLQQGLRAFKYNKGHFKQIEKLLRA
jgi:hypothetical protein